MHIMYIKYIQTHVETYTMECAVSAVIVAFVKA